MLLLNWPYTDRDLINEGALAKPYLIYLSGVLSLLAGLAIVIAHNRWSAAGSVIITAVGRLMVFGGVIRIVVPLRSRDGRREPFYAGRAAIVAVAILCVVLWRLFELQGL